MPESKPFMAGIKEIGDVYGVEKSLVSQWVKRDVVDAGAAVVVSGGRYWPLAYARAIGPNMRNPKEPDAEVLKRLCKEQAPGEWVASAKELPPIVGLQEITALFGLDDQRKTAAFARQGRFGSEDWRLSGSPLWLLDTIVARVPDLRAATLAAGLRGTREWTVDPGVEAALREGRYDGPGSEILARRPPSAAGE